MNAWLKRTAAVLAVLGVLSPAASWGFCNTDSDETKAVSSYALIGQGNFSCDALNMSSVSASITNPSELETRPNGIDWALAGNEVDVVTVADSKGKRCVYNYGPGATGGRGLTPNSENAAVEVFVCADGNEQSPPNAPPTVEIVSPMDNSVFDGGEPIELFASAEDPEDGPITAISWTSSIAGLLGTENPLTVTLGAGVHTITAQVQDSESVVGTDSVTVTVAAIVVAQCETIDGGSAVLINGTEVTCPSDDMGGFLPRVVCSADLSDTADKFELSNQGCCVCGVTAVECDPSLPSSAIVAPGQPGPCPAIKPGFDNLQVPTTILFNNDPYYCTTIGGRRTCYAY